MANAAVSVAAAAAAQRRGSGGASRALSAVTSRLVIIVPYLWLLFFFLIPFFIVFKISLSQTAIAMPPYTPVFDFGTALATSVAASANSASTTIIWLTEDALYFNAYVSSLMIAGDLDLPDAARRLSDRLRHGARAGDDRSRRC